MPRVPRELNERAGQRLRQCRQEAGLTLMQLARRLGISYQMVQKYEAGSCQIGVVRCQQIAQIFQRDLAWFLRE